MLNKIKQYRHAAVMLILLLFTAVFTQSCEEFEYSPYEVRLRSDEKDINKRNIEQLLKLNISPTDTLRFVLTSDPQGFYYENEILVEHINQQKGISFVMIGET
ncbi:hypothetical protein GCM10028895_00700 [Pontibacter rugosus]